MQRHAMSRLLSCMLPALACAGAVYLPAFEAAADPDVFDYVPQFKECFFSEPETRYVEVDLTGMYAFSTSHEMWNDVGDEVYVMAQWKGSGYTQRWPSNGAFFQALPAQNYAETWKFDDGTDAKSPNLIRYDLKHGEEIEISLAVMEDDPVFWNGAEVESAIIEGLDDLISTLEQVPGQEAEITADILQGIADTVPGFFPQGSDDILGFMGLRLRNACGTVTATVVTPQLDEVNGEFVVYTGNGTEITDMYQATLGEYDDQTFFLFSEGTRGAEYRFVIEVATTIPTPQ